LIIKAEICHAANIIGIKRQTSGINMIKVADWLVGFISIPDSPKRKEWHWVCSAPLCGS